MNGGEKQKDGATGAELKTKASKLLNELTKQKQSVSQSSGTAAAPGKGVQGPQRRGKGTGSGAPGGSQGNAKLVGLGSGGGKAVGAKAPGVSPGGNGVVVKSAKLPKGSPDAATQQQVQSIGSALVKAFALSRPGFRPKSGRVRHLTDDELNALGVHFKPTAKHLKTQAFVVFHGDYHEVDNGVNAAQATGWNKIADDYNERLDSAKRSLKGSKGAIHSASLSWVPKTWAEIPASGLPYDEAKYHEQLAIEQAGGETDSPLFGLREMDLVEPRPPQSRLVQRQSYLVDGSDSDVGIAHVTKKEHQRDVNDPMRDEKNGQVRGSELLLPVFVAGSGAIGAGCNLLPPVPCNPRFIDGVRVAKLLESYTQFRPVGIIFEYRAGCSTLTQGQFMMEYIDDTQDMIVTESGFAADRDAFTRPSKAVFQPWENAECYLAFPQQKWYYTGGQDVPGLEIPGQIHLQTMQLIDNTGSAASINYGLLAMHYVFEVRGPGTAGPIPQSYYASTATMSFDNATITAFTPVRIATSANPITATQMMEGVIYSGVIDNKTDPAGSATWRTWLPGEEAAGGAIVVAGQETTNCIFWRVLMIAGVPNICFFPTFGDALAAETYTSGGRLYLASATVVGGVKSFALTQITGTPANGSTSQ